MARPHLIDSFYGPAKLVKAWESIQVWNSIRLSPWLSKEIEIIKSRNPKSIYLIYQLDFSIIKDKLLCKMVNAMSELLTYAKNVVFTTKLFLLKEKLQINNCSKSFLFFYLGLYCLWTIEHVYATDTFFHTIWHLWEFHDRINKGVKSHWFACLALLMNINNISNRKSVQITEVVLRLLRLIFNQTM